MNPTTASGVQLQRRNTLGTKKERKERKNIETKKAVGQNSWSECPLCVCLCVFSLSCRIFSVLPINPLWGVCIFNEALDWDGLQPPVIMSHCASSWHIPVGCGNNYLSPPKAPLILLWLWLFSASVYSKPVALYNLSYWLLLTREFLRQEQCLYVEMLIVCSTWERCK